MTPRQRQCLVLAAQGLSDKKIARILGFTPRTAKAHMRDAREFLGARNRTEAVLGLARRYLSFKEVL